MSDVIDRMLHASIATALHQRMCGCPDWHPEDPDDPQYDDAATAVIETAGRMGLALQARLIAGTVEHGQARAVGWGDWPRPATRVLGPWIAVIPDDPGTLRSRIDAGGKPE